MRRIDLLANPASRYGLFGSMMLKTRHYSTNMIKILRLVSHMQYISSSEYQHICNKKPNKKPNKYHEFIIILLFAVMHNTYGQLVSHQNTELYTGKHVKRAPASPVTKTPTLAPATHPILQQANVQYKKLPQASPAPQRSPCNSSPVPPPYTLSPPIPQLTHPPSAHPPSPYAADSSSGPRTPPPSCRARAYTAFQGSRCSGCAGTTCT